MFVGAGIPDGPTLAMRFCPVKSPGGSLTLPYNQSPAFRPQPVVPGNARLFHSILDSVCRGEHRSSGSTMFRIRRKLMRIRKMLPRGRAMHAPTESLGTQKGGHKALPYRK